MSTHIPNTQLVTRNAQHCFFQTVEVYKIAFISESF